MGRNLTNLFISESFQYLVQVSGSAFETGLGSAIPSINITASNAVSSSYALTASFALNAGTTVNTGSLLTTASAAANVITFTKGDGSTFPVTIATGSAVSASFASTASLALNNVLTASSTNATITYTKGDGTTFTNVINNVVQATSSSFATTAISSSFATNANTATSASFATNANTSTSASYALSASQAQNAVSASLALNNVLTASVSSNTITFTKGDGTTFPITVNTGSAVTVSTGSLLTTASISNATTTFTKGDGSTFSITANNVVNADSASVATSASFATTASFASTIANGLSPTFVNVTASNVLITGTASVALLYTQTISSSVIYSSGSNQFGDASNDVQTLYGTFNVVTGPTNLTGSVNSLNGYTGSLLGTASYATNALSSSYAVSASQAQNAVSSSYALSASFAPATSPFPFTGSAQITGSLGITGSFSAASGSTILLNRLGINLSSQTGSDLQSNVTIGAGAGINLTTGVRNTLIGGNAFGASEATGYNLTTGQQNTIVGVNAGWQLTNASDNVFVGDLIGRDGFTSGNGNTILGSGAGQGMTAGGNENVYIGKWAGYNAAGGSGNVLIGKGTGFSIGNGSNNVFLGQNVASNAWGGTFNSSSYLAVGNAIDGYDPTGSLLFGNHGSSNRFLNINGNLRVTGSTTLQDTVVTGSLRVTGSNNTVGRLIVSQSVNDQTDGAFVLHSVRNGEDLIRMYEYGGQAVIKATRGNGLFFIEGGGGGNDYVKLNESIIVYPAGGAYTRENGVDISANTKITGSLVVTGSITISGSFTGSNVIGNWADTYTGSAKISQVVTLTQNEYNAISSPDANTLYVISGSTVFNPAIYATTGSNTFLGNQTVTGSVTATLGFTGSLLGTASYVPTLQQVTTAGATTNTSITINNTASADYWLVDTKPFAQVSTNTIIAGRIDGADEDFVLAGRNYAGGTANAITMTDGEFIYNESIHIFTGSVDLNSTLNVTGATTLKDDVIITGSLRGNVGALSISSQTASLDCSTGNFFTLLLVSGSTTFVNPSNILPGQTINLRVKQSSVASGSISFASSVKQVSGSAYVPTATANAEDIVTFIAFDSTNLYLSNIKNFV